MNNMKKRLISILVCVIVFLSWTQPVFAEDYYNTTGYFDRLLLGIVHGTSSIPLVGDAVQGIAGGLVGDICSGSDDGLHHATEFVDGTLRQKDGLNYALGICSYCGKQFEIYGADVKAAYDDYVTTLPAQGYSSEGHLFIQLAFKSGEILVDKPSNSSGTGYAVPLSKDYGSYFVRTGALDSGKHLTYFYSLFSNAVRCNFPYCLYSQFVFPVSGLYRMTESKHCDYTYTCSDGSSVKTSTYYPNSVEFVYHKKDSVFSDSGKDYMYPSNFSAIDKVVSRSGDLYGPVFELTPDISVSDTYSTTTRPTSITGGNYGIVGDNGQITKVEDNSTIINETNNTYYNPATGQTVPITGWTYDYSDRSYKVTMEGGKTSTVTYGDENISITETTVNESGDTITNNYTIYYLVGGSGSENPPCEHDWQESSSTAPTCTVPGSKLLTCSKCQQTKKESIPALGHDWQIKQTVTTEYDETGQLTQQGYTIFECSRCHEQYKSTDGTVPPGGGSGTDPGDEGETIWDKLGKLIGAIGKGLIDVVEAVFGKILDALISLVEMMSEKIGVVVETVLSMFDELPKIFGGFLDFLVALFPFLPPELMTILTFGVLAVVFIGIIKAVRR